MNMMLVPVAPLFTANSTTGFPFSNLIWRRKVETIAATVCKIENDLKVNGFYQFKSPALRNGLHRAHSFMLRDAYMEDGFKLLLTMIVRALVYSVAKVLTKHHTYAENVHIGDLCETCIQEKIAQEIAVSRICEYLRFDKTTTISQVENIESLHQYTISKSTAYMNEVLDFATKIENFIVQNIPQLYPLDDVA